MPQQGKSRRAAARQTQLGQRKKRHPRVPSAAPPPTTDAPQSREAEDLRTLGDEAGPLSERRPDASRPVAAQRPSPSIQAEPRPRVYHYIKSEIKRIFALSAGILAILIALTFVLR